MNIIASCLMNDGTFNAKFIPLSKVKKIDKIFVLRKIPGPIIDKVEYILLPKIFKYKWINAILTPFFLAYFTKKKNASLILSYHIIPHGFFAFAASLLTSIPFIVGQTGLFVQKYTKNYFFSFAVLYILKKAKYINVPGTSSKEFWISKGIQPEKINLLHSTIDTRRFNNTSNEKKFDFIYVGRFSKEKNVNLIIEAFSIAHKTIPELSLALVGYGPLKTELKSIVVTLNLQQYISFLGQQNQIEDFLNRSRVFIMASSSEGLPCSLMEAMSCELLVISTPVGNIKDVLEDEKSGLIIPVQDIQVLADKMIYAINNYDNLSNIRLHARNVIIQNHSYSSAIGKWKELI